MTHKRFNEVLFWVVIAIAFSYAVVHSANKWEAEQARHDV